MHKKPWLNIGWRVMVLGGIVNIFFSLASVYFMFLAGQPNAAFGSQDELYVGKTYADIIAFSPMLAHWIVLSMVGMCGMMIGWGVLMTAIAWGPYRRAEKWAWWALTISNLGALLYNGSLTILYLSKGLYGFSSALSTGLTFFIFWIVVIVVGLVLPAKEILNEK